MKMKSKKVKSMMPEFTGKPSAVRRAMKMDNKSDKAIAKRTGTKSKYR